MILLLLVGVSAFLLGTVNGTTWEWLRVLRYLDSHLHRDADWIRSGIAADEHHQPQRRTP